MQTNLAAGIRKSHHAETIETILRKCVHCGFCNATCPTYQLLGDELDGPRGRIYQMKQYFEGEAANGEMLLHLDRCLTCRSCETTCPSGVRYSELLEIGKEAIERELPRPLAERLKRLAIVYFINSGWLFALCLRIGQALAPLLPARLARSVPPRQQAVARENPGQARKVLMLAGCVQPTLTPNTNNYAVNLMQRLGIETVELPAGLCCGAAAMHSSAPDYGLAQVKSLIDACWPHVEAGVEAIVVTATGCGVSVRDFARLLARDPQYADKAERVSALYRDLVEIAEAGVESLATDGPRSGRIAVHTPCSMQHGLGLANRVEKLLAALGYEICEVDEAHLCCGSAGTYSMLQPVIAGKLRENKIRALSVDAPQTIVTANVGCQLHLGQESRVPVKHWVELL